MTEQILFIGLGNMGLPMAHNLHKAGHNLIVWDMFSQARDKASALGLSIAPAWPQALAAAKTIITMLPAGEQVRQVYQQEIFPKAGMGTLLIDCSTIDVTTSRQMAQEANSRKLKAADAPVSGGVAAAAAGTLTFMIGSQDADYSAVQAIIQPMGKNFIHCGGNGAGQAAKICNNLMLGIQMISVCEGFALAEKLGLAAEKLFAVSSKASGQCWSLTSYCPEPNLVETAPSNRDYRPGFSAAMMLKDLRLACEALDEAAIDQGLGRAARDLYQGFVEGGAAQQDFSAIIHKLKQTR